MVGKNIRPQNCVFSDIFGSDLTRRVVAFCMGIAICHRRKFGQVRGSPLPSSSTRSRRKTPRPEGTPFRKVAWFTKQKNLGSTGLVPAPIFAKVGRSCPKFPERCRPEFGLDWLHFAGLIRERLIFRLKKSIQGYQPTMIIHCNQNKS